MASLGSLVVSLAMDTAKFSGDIGKAAQQMKRLSIEAGKMGAAIGTALAAAGGIGIALVTQSINAADAVSKLAQQIGMTTEELTAYSYAADLAGISQEGFGAAMVKLSRNAADAARGMGDAKEAFAAMGVNAQNADGSLKGSSQLLTEIAEKFATYRDGAEKTALATMIFGKAGAQLIPMLNAGKDGLAELGAEAKAFGIVLETDTAKRAEAFRDNLSRLNAIKTGLADGIAAELLPMLVNLSSQFVETAKSSGALNQAARVAATGVRFLISAGALAIGVFKTLGEYVGGSIAVWVELLSGNFRRALDIAKNTYSDVGRNVMGTIETISAIWDDTAAKVEGNAATNGGKLAAPMVRAAEKTKAAKAEIDRVYEEIERRLGALQLQVDTQGASDRIKGLIELTQKGATPEQLQRYLKLAGAIEDYTAAQEKAAKADADRRATLTEIQAVYEATRTPAEKFANEIARLNDLHQQGMDWETYARGVDLAQEAFNNATKKATEMDSATKRLQKNIQDHIGDGLYQILDGNFKNIGKSFLQMLQRMAADALAADIAKKMFGASAGGAGGGWLGSIASGIGGLFGKGGGGTDPAAFAVMDFVPGHANGLDYVPYDNYLARLHKGERVQTADEARRGSGINVSIVNNAGVQVQTQDDGAGGLQILLERAAAAGAQRGYGMAVADVASGSGRMSAALKSRGVNLDSGLAKRG